MDKVSNEKLKFEILKVIIFNVNLYYERKEKTENPTLCIEYEILGIVLESN